MPLTDFVIIDASKALADLASVQTQVDGINKEIAKIQVLQTRAQAALIDSNAIQKQSDVFVTDTENNIDTINSEITATKTRFLFVKNEFQDELNALIAKTNADIANLGVVAKADYERIRKMGQGAVTAFNKEAEQAFQEFEQNLTVKLNAQKVILQNAKTAIHNTQQQADDTTKKIDAVVLDATQKLDAVDKKGRRTLNQTSMAITGVMDIVRGVSKATGMTIGNVGDIAVQQMFQLVVQMISLANLHLSNPATIGIGLLYMGQAGMAIAAAQAAEAENKKLQQELQGGEQILGGVNHLLRAFNY